MDHETNRSIDNIRCFNRFFSHFAGMLDQHFLGTGMTLAEARLLYEIAHADRPVAADLRESLGVDAGYLSRVLQRFEARGWITREKGEGDARRRPLVLTGAGREVFARLDERQRSVVADMLDRLEPAARRDVVEALTRARLQLGGAPLGDFALRPFRPGDMGMIAARQSLIYREIYGWGAGIEAIEAEVTANFLRNFKPGREQCWVAELDGVMAGSVFLTDEGNGLSRLRLLYVEPFARGHGVGSTLVETCVGFARMVGYRRMTLWTHTVLESARRIYAAQGFRIVDVHMHEECGKPLQGEIWELDLEATPVKQVSAGKAEAAPGVASGNSL